ncbi:MAG: DUF436 family protein, partial [Lachnospiraceae bacterium]|nr:DUF436 family protein [Lachnospiraceae bacterium]
MTNLVKGGWAIALNIKMAAGISNEKFTEIAKIQTEAKEILEDLIAQAQPEEGDLLIVGCSSSEVAAHKLGTFSSEEIGEALYSTISEC